MTCHEDLSVEADTLARDTRGSDQAMSTHSAAADEQPE